MPGGLPWRRENVNPTAGRAQACSIRSRMGDTSACRVPSRPREPTVRSTQDERRERSRQNGALRRRSDSGPALHEPPSSSPAAIVLIPLLVRGSARRDGRESSSWGALPCGARLHRGLIGVADAVLGDRLSALRALLGLEPGEDGFKEGVLQQVSKHLQNINARLVDAARQRDHGGNLPARAVLQNLFSSRHKALIKTMPEGAFLG